MAKISKLTLALSLLLITQLPALSQSWQEDDASARALMKQGKYDEAQDALLHALSNSPPEQRGSVLLHLSIVQRKSGNMEGARKTLTIAKEHASKSHDAALSSNVDKEIAKLQVSERPLPESIQDDLTQPQHPQNAKFLRGGLHLQDNLPALSTEIGPGNRFSQTRAQAVLGSRVQTRPGDTTKWRAVMPWLQGTWTSNHSTTTYSKNWLGLPNPPNGTHISQSTNTVGEVADTTGRVWEQEREGGRWSVETRGENLTTINFITKRIVVEANDYRQVDYMEGVAFQYDAAGIIRLSYQIALLNSQEFVSDGVLIEEQRKRTYGANGRPLSESVNVTERRRTHPFVDAAPPHLRDSLSVYLHSAGLGTLAPMQIAPVVGKSNP